MRAALLLLFLALCFLGTGCSKASKPANSGYDAAPFSASLRGGEVERAETALSAALNSLPYYALELNVAESLRAFDLKETLHFQNRKGTALKEVVLRVYVNATADKPPVQFLKGSCLDGRSCNVSLRGPSTIVVALDKPLEVDQRLRVTLELKGTLSHIEKSRTSMLSQSFESMARIRSGKGGGDYGLLAEGDGIASFASFYPVLARFGDGKWEYDEKSTMGDLGAAGMSHVSIDLELPKDAKLATSGVIARDAAAGAGRRKVRVDAGLVQDVSLLMSRQFQSAEKKVGNVTVRSHYLAGDAVAGAKVLDAAEQSLRIFEKRFGPYPYVDLDVVEAPLVGGAGGVEFSGLVTVASMFYRPRFADGSVGMLLKLIGGPSQKELERMTSGILEFVTAHEVAHQYFPGLVGSDIRKHPFADEAMAQWAALLYFEDRYGPERAKSEADRQVLANYHMMRLMDMPDAAVDRPVEAFDSEIAYAGLVYGKGPFFFRELRKLVGDAEYFRALRAVIDKHRFQQAPPRALSKELARGANTAKVNALTKRWLSERHGDADLGKPDIRTLLGAWIGPEMAAQLGPEVESAVRLMLKLMMGKGGSGDLGGVLEGLLGGD